MKFRQCIIMPALLAGFILFADSAHAYLDPGTGSMIIQGVLAGIAAVSVSVGIFWTRIKLFFGRVFGGNKADDNQENE